MIMNLIFHNRCIHYIRTMAKGFSVKTNTSPEYYKIEEQVTTGWEIIETNLTKEECKEQYEALIGMTEYHHKELKSLVFND